MLQILFVSCCGSYHLATTGPCTRTRLAPFQQQQRINTGVRFLAAARSESVEIKQPSMTGIPLPALRTHQAQQPSVAVTLVLAQNFLRSTPPDHCTQSMPPEPFVFVSHHLCLCSIDTGPRIPRMTCRVPGASRHEGTRHHRQYRGALSPPRSSALRSHASPLRRQRARPSRPRPRRARGSRVSWGTSAVASTPRATSRPTK